MVTMLMDHPNDYDYELSSVAQDILEQVVLVTLGLPNGEEPKLSRVGTKTNTIITQRSKLESLLAERAVRKVDLQDTLAIGRSRLDIEFGF